ncbi:MAG: hypothetical protein GY834_00565 [Bacteroidetes bacterium]|nr:hypothetical protein [Bacteroidota bacterium]
MIRNIINTFGTRLSSAIINLLIIILVSQYLGSFGKGQQGLIIASIAYILVFSNIIGGSTLVYLLPRYGHSLLILPSYIWSILMSLGFYLLLFITRLVELEFIIHICILSIMSSFISINSNVLIAKEKIKTANQIGIIQPISLIIFILLFFLVNSDASIHSYISSLYISFGITLLLSFVLMLKHEGKISIQPITDYFKPITEMYKLGVLNQLSHVFQLLSFRMSFYWLAQIYSETEVGIYSIGTSLVESVWLISRSISLVQYARIANVNDKKYAQSLTLNLGKISFLISFILLLPFVFLPPTFYEFVFGNGFAEVSKVVRMLIPGVLFLNLNIIISHYFSGTGKYHINSISSFLGFVVALILFNWLIPAYGIIGAGLASSISYIFTTVVVVTFYKRDSKLSMQELLDLSNLRLIEHFKTWINQK